MSARQATNRKKTVIMKRGIIALLIFIFFLELGCSLGRLRSTGKDPPGKSETLWFAFLRVYGVEKSSLVLLSESSGPDMPFKISSPAFYNPCSE